MIRVDTMRSLLHGQTDNFQIGRVSIHPNNAGQFSQCKLQESRILFVICTNIRTETEFEFVEIFTRLIRWNTEVSVKGIIK